MQWPIHKRAPQTECSQRNHYPKGNHSLRPQSRSPTRRPNREAEGAQILEELSRKARIVSCTGSHSESNFRARNQCLTTALVALSVRRAHGEDAASAALLGSPRPSPPHLPCEPARSFDNQLCHIIYRKRGLSDKQSTEFHLAVPVVHFRSPVVGFAPLRGHLSHPLRCSHGGSGLAGRTPSSSPHHRCRHAHRLRGTPASGRPQATTDAWPPTRSPQHVSRRTDAGLSRHTHARPLAHIPALESRLFTGSGRRRTKFPAAPAPPPAGVSPAPTPT